MVKTFKTGRSYLAKAQRKKKEEKSFFFVKGNKKLSYLKVFLLGADQPTNQPTSLESFETWGDEKDSLEKFSTLEFLVTWFGSVVAPRIGLQRWPYRVTTLPFTSQDRSEQFHSYPFIIIMSLVINFYTK